MAKTSDMGMCCATTRGDTTAVRGWRTSRRCTKAATVERDGKPYCGTHDPVRVAERREQSMAAWTMKMNAEKELSRLHKAAPELLAACEIALLACLPGASDEERRAAWDSTRQAIAKAKGDGR